MDLGSDEKCAEDQNTDMPAWSELPLDIVAIIFFKLSSAEDVARAKTVCQRFREAFPRSVSLSFLKRCSQNSAVNELSICRMILGTRGLKVLKVGDSTTLDVEHAFSASGLLGILRHVQPTIEILHFCSEDQTNTEYRRTPHRKGDGSVQGDLFIDEVG
jgi:hypothetical protein